QSGDVSFARRCQGMLAPVIAHRLQGFSDRAIGMAVVDQQRGGAAAFDAVHELEVVAGETLARLDDGAGSGRTVGTPHRPAAEIAPEPELPSIRGGGPSVRQLAMLIEADGALLPRSAVRSVGGEETLLRFLVSRPLRGRR